MRSAALSILTVLSFAGTASAAISSPFPGVTLIEESGRKMAIANLCAPGVAIRATKYGERKGTPQDWAGKVDAEIASNADFFEFPGWSWVQGRAKGGGEDWPADAQWKSERDRSYWQFGPFLAGNVHPGTIDVDGAATDVFGGHDIIIASGKNAGPWSGDFYNGAHTRTAFGISADRKTIYLMVTTAAVGVGTVADWMIGDAKAAGASPIETATNLDGGGSSQLYVKGRGQIISTGRLVNNHVGIFAKGSGAAPNCPNHPPQGYLDSATCDGIKGWAQDPDAPASAIDVHLYFDGTPGAAVAGTEVLQANVKRDDLCKAIGSCDHGYESAIPMSLQDGKPHVVHAYGIDTDKGDNPELASAKTFTCTASIPTGVRRHIVSTASIESWKFRPFLDQVTLSDSAYASIPAGPDLPAERGAVVQAEGSPEVWLVDGTTRRHIPSPAVAERWQIDLGAVEKWSAEKLTALTVGPKLRDAPLLVRGSGPAIDLVDDDPTAVPDAGIIDDAGTLDDAGEPDAGDAPTPDRLDDSNAAGGCGCHATTSSTTAWPLLGLLALGWLRRKEDGRSARR